MRNLLLCLLIASLTAACSTNSEEKSILDTAWDSITTKQTAEISSTDALKNYTNVIYQHSKERSARYSYQIVQLCNITEGGMDEQQLTALLDKDFEIGKRCWSSIANYSMHDIRFYKDGSKEKSALYDFNQNLKKYSSMFSMK